MTTYQKIKHSAGISLIEALVAMVVISVGTLSIVKLQTELTAAGGLSKARVVAVQLAQEKIEEMRNLAIADDYDAIAGGADDPTTIGNAEFTRTWVVTPITTDGQGDRRQVVVSVAWVDAKDGQQVVQLSTVIGWDDPIHSATLAEGDLPGGGFIRPPTGTGEIIDEEIDELPQDALEVVDGVYSAVVDGKRTLIVEDGGEYRAVMRLQNDEEFSTISGSIFVDDSISNYDEVLALDSLFIFTSDAVFCSRTEPEEEVNGHYYTDYTCFAGPQWYGNIALMRPGSQDIVERFCVGDPAYAVPEPEDRDVYGFFPQRSSRRSYRAVDPNTNFSLGIGMHNDDGVYDPIHYEGHHFLLTEIATQGQQDGDVNCGVKMDASGLDFAGNPGRYFCMNDHCPEAVMSGDPEDPTDPGDSGDLLVAFTGGGTTDGVSVSDVFDAQNDNQMNDRFSMPGADCRIRPVQNYNQPDFVFDNCVIDEAGRGAEPWDATMTFISFEDGDYRLCAVTATVSPCTEGECGTVTFNETQIIFTDMLHTLDTVTLSVEVAELCVSEPEPE